MAMIDLRTQHLYSRVINSYRLDSRKIASANLLNLLLRPNIELVDSMPIAV